MARKKDLNNEWKHLKKFELENEKLRKEIARLRKQAQTAFVDRSEERATRLPDEVIPVRHVCENCGNDEVSIIPLKRSDGEFEIRICKLCQFKSEMKRKKSKKKSET